MHHNVHGERIDQLYLQPVDAYHTFIGTASYTALRSQAETGSAYHREVQLSEVLAVDEGRAGLVGGAEEGSNFSFALRCVSTLSISIHTPAISTQDRQHGLLRGGGAHPGHGPAGVRPGP